jgi:alkanesulfonate monooxygenase SsuD/methylene tetrahydromethanopterin reductase-like flavin-dependent oxidoreductase (luciferase family)
MKLGIFMMPLHPPERDPLRTLQEDREAILLADRLGFHDAFVGEHLTDRCENVTNSFIFLATLIHETRAIRLGTGTSNLSHTHPALVAAHAAMFDHLAQGRFIFGISPGALSSDAEALGIFDEDRNKMFAEAIDVILAIWERALRHRLPGKSLQGLDRKNPGAGDRPRRDVQAVPEAAPGNRRYRGGAPFQRGHRHGRARLSPDVGKLPARALASQSLGKLCPGKKEQRPNGKQRRLAGRADHLRRG